MSRASTRQNRTGSWKYIRPLYRDAVAPCNQACPAGVDVEGYMNLLREGRVDDAVDLLLRENPMPAITGRVCHHPCETGCNRRDVDEAVSVHAVERALGDFSLRHPHPPPPPVLHPERVAVVGGGPAGLSCGYHLARLGYVVTIYDEAAEAGGLLRQGIPSYRLPREVLDRQIDRIVSMGVDIRTGVHLAGDAARAELDGYDAVFYATGAHRGKPMGVEGEDGPGISAGLEFLKAVNRGERPELGKRVAVIGGGNTAMDCARTALRLGCEPVVVYRRTRDEMPAIPQEIDEAMGEGIEFVFLAAPAGFGWSDDGRLTEMRVTRMELGEPDASGRRRPVPIDDGGYVLQVDTVLAAIGEDTDLGVLPPSLPTQWGAVSVNDFGATGADVRGGSGGAGGVGEAGEAGAAPVFAGGDVAGAERTVADALGSGKRAAMGIDQHFRGFRDGENDGSVLDGLRWGRGQVSMSRWRGDDPVRRTNPTNEVVDVGALQLAHFPTARRHLDRWREGWVDFGEVNLGIDLEDAVAEARRCFNCGVCNDCELCLILCPDVAITRREGGGFEIDLEHCKGCGVCAEECPRGAIVMTREGL